MATTKSKDNKVEIYIYIYSADIPVAPRDLSFIWINIFIYLRWKFIRFLPLKSATVKGKCVSWLCCRNAFFQKYLLVYQLVQNCCCLILLYAAIDLLMHLMPRERGGNVYPKGR